MKHMCSREMCNELILLFFSTRALMMPSCCKRTGVVRVCFGDLCCVTSKAVHGEGRTGGILICSCPYIPSPPSRSPCLSCWLEPRDLCCAGIVTLPCAQWCFLTLLRTCLTRQTPSPEMWQYQRPSIEVRRQTRVARDFGGLCLFVA